MVKRRCSVFKAAGGRSVFWECHPLADLENHCHNNSLAACTKKPITLVKSIERPQLQELPTSSKFAYMADRKKSWHCTGKILNTPWFSCPEYKSPWTWTKWGNCAMFWQTHSREQANIKNCFDLICWYLLLLQLYLDTSSHEDCQLFDNMRLSEYGREEICESLKRISRVQTNRLSKDSCGSYVVRYFENCTRRSGHQETLPDWR